MGKRSALHGFCTKVGSKRQVKYFKSGGVFHLPDQKGFFLEAIDDTFYHILDAAFCLYGIKYSLRT